MTMKKRIQLSILCLSIIALSVSSCSKSLSSGTIVQDCTGTYLKLNNKDYLICNPEIAIGYPNGSSVEVKYNSKSSYPTDAYEAVCLVLHESYGFVEITKIK